MALSVARFLHLFPPHKEGRESMLDAIILIVIDLIVLGVFLGQGR